MKFRITVIILSLVSVTSLAILGGSVLRNMKDADTGAESGQSNPSAEEVWAQSINLLSAGKQSEASDLISAAAKRYPMDPQILFAQAVLKRSFFNKSAANMIMLGITLRGIDDVIIKACRLSMKLDRTQSRAKLKELIQLSDENPENIYLLWLSAIQCREQRSGSLGKRQYEKLLSKFELGPVMAHHTYANILTEEFDDYETALHHRKIAASMKSRGWIYQGLGNTLTDMGRYEEACAAWAEATRLEPDDASYWRRWGQALEELERYKEALEKYNEALKLNPGSGKALNRAGLCLKELKRYDEMLSYFRKAADMEYSYGQYNLARCYRFGSGVEKNISNAIKWYHKAANQEHLGAQYDLARIYDFGEGVEQDLEKALYWYEKAADQGDEDSQHAVRFLKSPDAAYVLGAE